jgi:hypothetical protein
MIKISKIRISILLLIVVLLFSTTSCTSCINKYTEMPNGVTLNVSSEIKNHLIQETLPSLHFDYDGVRVMMESHGSACFFVSNDQYILSDKFAEHLSKYNKEQISVVSCVDQEYDEGKAIFDGKKLELDSLDEFGNEQKFSKEYQLVITDLDGTRYSYQFRTFVSGAKRYYIFRYSSNMGISMEQPLMVIKDSDGKNKLVLVALPYETKYEVGPNNIKLEALLEKDTYLDDKYYKYAYPDSIKDLSDNERREKVMSWYKIYCNGHFNENNEFIFEYYKATFKVEFGITDAGNERNKEGFKITYLG